MTNAAPDPAAALIPHEIGTRNLLLGASRFLTLRLPSTWDLAPGVGPPEVVASHHRRHQKWVSSGRAWYVLHNAERKWAMELALEIGHRRPYLPPGAGSEPVVVDGHEGWLRRWQRSRGLFRRWQVHYVEVAYNCPQTDRYVRIELSGRCEEAAFEEVLATVSEWRCH
jgi:hypothetical protein